MTNKITEQIVGRLLPTGKTNEKPDILGTFKFRDLEICPLNLEEGHNYIITCWDSNIYIKALKDNHFEILETLGSELTLDKEYLLIQPSY
jgi:hypothetical protein